MSDTFTICFRVPNKLRAPLTKLAAANRRSINAEVVMAIEGHVANDLNTQEMMRQSAKLMAMQQPDLRPSHATIKRLQKNQTVERATTKREKSNDRCAECRHMRMWHHIEFVPISGAQGRGPECRKCIGRARDHWFEFEPVKNAKERKS